MDVGRLNSTRKDNSLPCFSRYVMWYRYFLVQQLTSSYIAALALFSILIYITAPIINEKFNKLSK